MALTMMLTARAMGYDSCPMIEFDPDAVAEIIGLPENQVIAMMLVIGKGISTPWPKAGFVEKIRVAVSGLILSIQQFKFAHRIQGF